MRTSDAMPRVAVGAVVLDRATGGPRVVLIRRARAPLEGRWSLPGGRVEPGERLEEAVRREVLEETGLAVKVGRLLEVVEVIEAGFHYVILDYLCEPTEGALRAGSDAAEAAWVSAFDLAEYAVTPAVARVVSRGLADGDEE
jgi:mutator protein MutT